MMRLHRFAPGCGFQRGCVCRHNARKPSPLAFEGYLPLHRQEAGACQEMGIPLAIRSVVPGADAGNPVAG